MDWKLLIWQDKDSGVQQKSGSAEEVGKRPVPFVLTGAESNYAILLQIICMCILHVYGDSLLWVHKKCNGTKRSTVSSPV